jgi:hypothetical protein
VGELVFWGLGIAGWEMNKVGVLINVGVIAIVPVGRAAQVLLLSCARRESPGHVGETGSS